MVREKYLQTIIDIVRAKGCVTRRIIVDHLLTTYNLKYEQAERATDEALESLLKRNVITRRGRGVYCWAGPP